MRYSAKFVTNGGMLLVQGYAKRNIWWCKRVPQRMSRYCTVYWQCAEYNKNAVGVLKLIKVERQSRMEKEISELKMEINGVKKCADDASKKCIEIMKKEMADVVKSMSEDINEIKTSLAQEAMKLETAIEAKLVDSVGKEEVFSCVRELREEVIGISNEANKAVEKKVILIAEELEIEKSKNNLIFVGIKENGTMSDKDTVDEILREELKYDSSRQVEEVSRVG